MSWSYFHKESSSEGVLLWLRTSHPLLLVCRSCSCQEVDSLLAKPRSIYGYLYCHQFYNNQWGNDFEIVTEWISWEYSMRGSKGGGGGFRTPPPPEFAKLNIADITGNKKISHICALPQLYVKQNQSYLRLDPPGKIFWIRTCYSIGLNNSLTEMRTKHRCK